MLALRPLCLTVHWIPPTLLHMLPFISLFSVSGGMSHPVFCLQWDVPPCFLFLVGHPTLFSVCGGTSHPVFCLRWDVPPCFLFVVGRPTMFSVCSGTFLLGTLTLSPQKGNSQHQPFPDSEFNHFGWSNYIGIFF